MPDVSTEVAIATTTLSSAASTITFSTISGSYTDLRVVLTGKAVSGGVIYPAARFNSDTGTNYSNIFLVGIGSSAIFLNSFSNSTSIFIPSPPPPRSSTI